jgi:hypothetical protein
MYRQLATVGVTGIGNGGDRGRRDRCRAVGPRRPLRAGGEVLVEAGVTCVDFT